MKRAIYPLLLTAVLLLAAAQWREHRGTSQMLAWFEPSRASAQSPPVPPSADPPAQLLPGFQAGAQPMGAAAAPRTFAAAPPPLQPAAAPPAPVQPTAGEDEDAGFAKATPGFAKASPAAKPAAKPAVKGGARLGAPAGAAAPKFGAAPALPGRAPAALPGSGSLPGSGALPGRSLPPSVPNYPVAGGPPPASSNFQPAPNVDSNPASGFQVAPPTAARTTPPAAPANNFAPNNFAPNNFAPNNFPANTIAGPAAPAAAPAPFAPPVSAPSVAAPPTVAVQPPAAAPSSVPAPYTSTPSPAAVPAVSGPSSVAAQPPAAAPAYTPVPYSAEAVPPPLAAAPSPRAPLAPAGSVPPSAAGAPPAVASTTGDRPQAYSADLAPPMSYRAKRRIPDFSRNAPGEEGAAPPTAGPDGGALVGRYPTTQGLPTTSFPTTSTPNKVSADDHNSAPPAAAENVAAAPSRRGSYPAALADDGRDRPSATNSAAGNSGTGNAGLSGFASKPLVSSAASSPAPSDVANPLAASEAPSAPAAGGYQNPWADAPAAPRVASTVGGAAPQLPSDRPAASGSFYANPFDDYPKTASSSPAAPAVEAPAAVPAPAVPAAAAPSVAAETPVVVSRIESPAPSDGFLTGAIPPAEKPLAAAAPAAEELPKNVALADTGFSPGSIKRFPGRSRFVVQEAPVAQFDGSKLAQNPSAAPSGAAPTAVDEPSRTTAVTVLPIPPLHEVPAAAPTVSYPSTAAAPAPVVGPNGVGPNGSAAPASLAANEPAGKLAADPNDLSASEAAAARRNALLGGAAAGAAVAAAGAAWSDREGPSAGGQAVDAARPGAPAPAAAGGWNTDFAGNGAPTGPAAPAAVERAPQTAQADPSRGAPTERAAYAPETFRVRDEATVQSGPAEVLEASVLARVDGDVVLAGEILPAVNKRIESVGAQIPEEQKNQIREMLIQQQLQQIIQRKIVVNSAKRELPEKAMPQIEKQLDEGFDKRLEEIIVDNKLNGRLALDEFFQKQGTTLETQRKIFHESMIARQWMQKNSEVKEDVQREELLNYYYDHQKDYEIIGKARWEEVMVSVARTGSKDAAWAAVAQAGNRILAGEPFADVAKSVSHGATADAGGVRDWTTENGLKYKAVNDALFSLPVGQLSPILESEQGFHIVRVLERKPSGYVPFREAQKEIKTKIVDERRKKALEEYLKKLRKESKVWTVFDKEPAPEAPVGIGQAPTNVLR